VRSLPSFDPAKGSFRAWLATIARNLARNRWAGRAQPDSFDPDLAEVMLLDEHNPSVPAERREQLSALDDCVAQLPTMLAVLVRLRYVEGKTTRAMSDATGMPESTVRKRLDEARSALARCLEQKGIEP
jgi:RNA polymerase sigma-70 factor (ECF subfamily)